MTIKLSLYTEIILEKRHTGKIGKSFLVPVVQNKQYLEILTFCMKVRKAVSRSISTGFSA